MNYLVIHNERQEGPLNAEEIKSRVDSGELEWTDLCWREGWRQWRPIGSVAALAPAEAFAKAPESGAADCEENWLHRRHGSHAWTIVFVVAFLFCAAGLVVLSVLLVQARDRIAELEQAAKGREPLERAIATKSLEARAPVPPDEIKIWATFLDPATNRPMPVSRGNILLYSASSVSTALEGLAARPPGISSMLEEIRNLLPPPQRETITDSEGFAMFTGLSPGEYVVVAFSLKSSDVGESPYLWIAKCRLDGQPHSTLVLSETNATRADSGLQVIAR